MPLPLPPLFHLQAMTLSPKGDDCAVTFLPYSIETSPCGPFGVEMSSQQLRSAPGFPVLVVAALLVIAGAFLLNGCSEAYTSTATTGAAVKLTGNWQLTSSAPAASKLSALSGEITGTSASATAIFHSDSASACAPPSVVAVLAGSTNASGLTSFSGSYAGGTLIVIGTPSADGKSLTNASYAVSGGTCGFTAPAQASAQSVAAVSGTYSGTFTDVYGNQIPVSTVLSQSAPDADGNFVLSGYANVPAGNGCFTTPTNTDSAQVTGQQFNISYADPSTGNTLVTSGSVSVDATTLTVGAWTITGPCAGENGTGGTLTRQN